MVTLSSTPYFDDFDANKKFARILFKPGVAVQTRELNQLQTLLQEQVRRFGDNVLKNGTIVSGGQITLHDSLPFVKVLDNDGNGLRLAVSTLINSYVTNTAGVNAIIVSAVDGSVSNNPDLNTLFVKYINSGASGTSLTFLAGDTLTIYDPLTSSPLSQLTVAPVVNTPIGIGYGVSIGEGVVYHAGFFTRFEKQIVIVSKYDNLPDQLSVGFDTTFDIVTSNDDVTLLDPIGSFAPGADRLRANAKAIVISSTAATARADFLSIIQFTLGQPYKQSANTQYNVLDQTLARRTFEQAGNYVINQFALNTKSSTIDQEPTNFNVVIDPGIAYLKGFRVSTDRNYTTSVPKATTTISASSVSVGVEYGNYIVVERFNGDPTTLVGSTINLNNTAQTYAVGGNVNITGTNIGQARVRGIKFLDRGVAGTRVKIYIFDLKFNQGLSISNTLSVNGSNFSANMSGTPAVVDQIKSTAIFNGPASAIKSLANVVYTVQRSSWGGPSSNTSGTVSLTVTGTDAFEVQGSLTRSYLDSLIIAPGANTSATTSKTGTLTTTASSNTVTGVGTSFITDIRVGQWIDVVGQTPLLVSSVVNNTSLSVSVSSTPAYTGSAYAFRSFYPKWEPLYVLSGTVVGQTMTLNTTEPVATTPLVAVVPVRTSPGVASKAITRNAVVRLDLSTNTYGIKGPWALGLPDIFHLRGVYKGTNTSFLATDSGVLDITNEFFIDANHDPNLIGIGYLYKRTTSSLVLTTADRLLVVFDVMSTTGTGLRTVNSYPLNDAVNLASSSVTMNTVELPEVFGAANSYYDVRDAYDFRPIVANTVSISTSQATASVNPSEPVYATEFASIGVFPAPESLIQGDVQYYQSRRDRVVINTSGSFIIVPGQPGGGVTPAEPKDCLTINALLVPAYPSIPFAASNDLAAFIDTRIANQKFGRRRIASYTIKTLLSDQEITADQPKGYRMTDIGDIDRRLQNVEYYLTLTMAETQTNQRLIPSANNSNVDRFKFGYFVDAFQDSSLSDIANPQFNASIAEGILRPKTKNVVINFSPINGSGDVISLPFTDFVLINQNIATAGPIVQSIPNPTLPSPSVPNPPSLTPPVSVSNVVSQIQTSQIVQNTQAAVDPNGGDWDGFGFYLSSQSGTGNIFFGSFGNFIAIEISQSFTQNVGFGSMGPLLVSGSSATSMSTPEVTAAASFLGGDAYNPFRLFGGVVQVPVSPARYVIYGAGKLSYNYNPANGRWINIRVYRLFYNGTENPPYAPYSNGAFTNTGKYILQHNFPIDGTNPVGGTTLPTTFNYAGSVVSVTPPSLNLTPNTQTSGSIQYFIEAQAIRIKAAGLKPLTQHTFVFDSVDHTIDCVLYNTTGNTFTTDSSGFIDFTFYLKGLNISSAYTAQNAANYNQAAMKQFNIGSADGVSKATGFIAVPPYGDPKYYYLQAGRGILNF